MITAQSQSNQVHIRYIESGMPWVIPGARPIKTRHEQEYPAPAFSLSPKTVIGFGRSFIAGRDMALVLCIITATEGWGGKTICTTYRERSGERDMAG